MSTSLMTSYSSGRELLRQVISRYRALDYYADTGQVLDLTKPRSEPLAFATAFRRPDFKFTFSSPHPYRPLNLMVSRTQIGVREGQAYFWDQSYSASAKLEQEDSLLMAIAGATGSASGQMTIVTAPWSKAGMKPAGLRSRSASSTIASAKEARLDIDARRRTIMLGP